MTWARLGALARRVVEAPLTDAPEALFSRFGRDVAHAWRAHVRWNVEQIVTSERLVVRGVVGADDTEWLRDRLAPLEGLAVPFGLAHGDLEPRNTVVDEGGELWLVDWGAATTGPAPFVDTTHLIHAAAERRAAATDALRALLEGFGPDPDAEQTADAVALLQALDLVHWAEDRAPERLDRQVSLARTLVERARPR